jgi:hypothetical protein
MVFGHDEKIGREGRTVGGEQETKLGCYCQTLREASAVGERADVTAAYDNMATGDLLERRAIAYCERLPKGTVLLGPG